jgi:transcriptional regulator with XRE-family HTH domain
MKENAIKNLSICERFFQILDYYGDTRYKFSKESGISEAVLSNIYQKKNPPKVEVIWLLLNKYKEIDANWLLTGTGSMTKRIMQKKNNIDNTNASSSACFQGKYNNNNSGVQENKEKNIVKGKNNIVASENSTIYTDNRQYYSDSPDVLRAQIEEKDKLIIEKDERLREKDAYILELKEAIHELKNR